MIFRVTTEMDMTIVDDMYAHNEYRYPKKPIGETRHFDGTREELKEKLCDWIDQCADTLEHWWFNASEEEIER